MHAEYPGVVGTAVVTALACSLTATEIIIDVEPVSQVAAASRGATRLVERTNCNYGLEPSMAWIAEAEGLRVVARDDTGEARAVERTDHPFFVATLYQPQRHPDQPHPLLIAFARAAGAARPA